MAAAFEVKSVRGEREGENEKGREEAGEVVQDMF